MYGTPSHLVIGFHACDRSVGEKILSGKAQLQSSANDYDWLGSGRYFWEGNYERATEYGAALATRKKSRKLKRPFVLGAIIDLGYCLNLLESENLRLLLDGYKHLKHVCDKAGTPMPENKDPQGSGDLLLRNLDCAVIEAVHQLRIDAGAPAFDSVRGVFWEGRELYCKAGFRSHNHIQICIRNQNCIKGYFRPLDVSPAHRLPSKILD